MVGGKDRRGIIPDVGMGADQGGMGVVEGFVGVDVADANEDSLVEEGWFDAGAFGADFFGRIGWE